MGDVEQTLADFCDFKRLFYVFWRLLASFGAFWQPLAIDGVEQTLAVFEEFKAKFGGFGRFFAALDNFLAVQLVL